MARDQSITLVFQFFYAVPQWNLRSVISKKNIKVEELEIEVKQQLIEWFGETAQKWKNIQVYRIKQAVPVCECPTKAEMRINGIFRCGDYLGLPSIDAAMRSGREVAESIMASDWLTEPGLAGVEYFLLSHKLFRTWAKV